MQISVKSYAKINLRLQIGQKRPDGFHGLRTLYATIALHDEITVKTAEGDGIEVRCSDPRVPCDATNTCYKAAERVLAALEARSKVVISIEKRLPVQGGL